MHLFVGVYGSKSYNFLSCLLHNPPPGFVFMRLMLKSIHVPLVLKTGYLRLSQIAGYHADVISFDQSGSLIMPAYPSPNINTYFSLRAKC